jgi:ACS family hexuronate transporter-like MFS transporter
MTQPLRTHLPAAAPRAGRLRWVVCALLLFAAIINYMDRQIIGILKPTLVEEFGWSDERIYASIIFSFQLAYALGFLAAGRFMDALGVRRGFALAVVLWSLAAVAHGAADRVTAALPVLNLDARTGFALVTLGGAAAGYALARFALGLGEAGSFPASIKAVAEWFPRQERALATGIFNSGTNVGALLTPLLVPWIAASWGWRWSFVATGVLGFAWVAWWLAAYRPPEAHPRLSAAELAWIRSDPAEPAREIPWRRLLPHRQTWAFAIGKFLTDPIWWLYLFWVPDFLHRTYQVRVTASEMGPPLLTIYLIADVGSIGGGWVSSHLIRRGLSANRARKLAMLLCAACVVPIVFAASGLGRWTAVLLISLAAAAHQGWSANLFTLASDMFPRQAVGSVVGIGGTAGAVGGMFIAMLVGAVLQATGSYLPVFAIAGSAYLVALGIIHLLAPTLRRAEL